MLDLFFMEAQGQLSVLKESLSVLTTDISNKNELESLLRASSSLKAAAKLASLDIVFEIAVAQENFFNAVSQEKQPFTTKSISIIKKSVDLLSQLVIEGTDNADVWLKNNTSDLIQQKQNLESLSKNKSTKKEKSGKKISRKKSSKKNTTKSTSSKADTTKNISHTKNKENQLLADLSMQELFRMEAETQTKTLNDNLLELENSPANLTIIEELMRAAHSIKGAARMVSLDATVKIAHTMEDIFVAAQNSKLEISYEDMDVLLVSVDMIAAMAKATSQDYMKWIGEQKSNIDELSVALNAVLKGNKKQPLSFTLKEEAQKTENITSVVSNLENQSGKEKLTQDNSTDNVVRVSTQSLNRLQGLSGEALVETRWLSPFSDSLLQIKKRQTELISTLDRLRDHLFDLDVDEYIYELMNNTHHKANNCRDLLNQRLTELETYDRRSNSLSHRLNREVLQARMRPFSDGIQGLQRLVRDVSHSLNKKINLDIRGLSTQVDRDILEKLQSPLNHMIRNAIDHGIESPVERKKAGKNETGTIRLEAIHNAGMLLITIEDDGCGIDLGKIRKKIISKGMITQDMAESLTDTELLDFMFLPNFSTREAVTEISGRGVGLDVVHSVMQELRGQIRSSSTLGKGLKFQLNLPLTLSVIRALMVDISGEPYAFPLARIDQTIKISKQHIETMEGRQYFTYGNRHIGLITSHQILEISDNPDFDDEISVVILGDRINSYGVVVDKLLGERNLVVHTLDPRLGKIQDISAASLTENGTPLLIFDVDDLLRSIDLILSGGRINALSKDKIQLQTVTTKRILIVDDSITVREVERNLLQSNGYQVEVAVDGMDGWNAARTTEYDLIVSDIDMPRMNGFEFVSKMKNDERVCNIPIIIVSYKDREEDRQRGLEVGADYYLTKGSFHDETLLEAVIELIGDA